MRSAGLGMTTQIIEFAGPGHRWFGAHDGRVAAGFRAVTFGLAAVLGYLPTATHGFGFEIRFTSFPIFGKHNAREDVGTLALYLFRASFFLRLSVTVGRWTAPEELVTDSPPPLEDDGVVQKGDYE